jgi:transglutaminase/protease-like cytokinesis protein 3
MKTIKKLGIVVIMLLFVAGMSITVSAKPKLTAKKNTIEVGKNIKVTLKGVKTSNIKKVKYSSSKNNILTVKKINNKKVKVTAKKKGTTRVKAKITYKKKVNGKKAITVTYKVTVKKKTNGTNNSNGNADNSDSDVETVYWYQHCKKINEYVVYDFDSVNNKPYGFVCYPEKLEYTSPQFYSEENYNKILEEMDRIINDEAHITDSMCDQEKAYRLGRYLANNVKYSSDSDQSIYDTLFKKKTMCEGYATTYKILCKKVGVQCEFVCTDKKSYSESGADHAWNIVKLYDYWYLVDLTSANCLKNSGINSLIPYFRTEENFAESVKYIASFYKTKDFTLTHPIDTLELPARGRQDGITFLTDEELYALP